VDAHSSGGDNEESGMKDEIRFLRVTEFIRSIGLVAFELEEMEVFISA